MTAEGVSFLFKPFSPRSFPSLILLSLLCRRSMSFHLFLIIRQTSFPPSFLSIIFSLLLFMIAILFIAAFLYPAFFFFLLPSFKRRTFRVISRALLLWEKNKLVNHRARKMEEAATSATAAAAALTVTETLLEGEGIMSEKRRQLSSPPKKRVILLTAFFVCISFLIFMINMLSSLISQFMKNEQVWSHLGLWLNATMDKCARGNETEQ